MTEIIAPFFILQSHSTHPSPSSSLPWVPSLTMPGRQLSFTIVYTRSPQATNILPFSFKDTPLSIWIGASWCGLGFSSSCFFHFPGFHIQCMCMYLYVFIQIFSPQIFCCSSTFAPYIPYTRGSQTFCSRIHIKNFQRLSGYTNPAFPPC